MRTAPQQLGVPASFLLQKALDYLHQCSWSQGRLQGVLSVQLPRPHAQKQAPKLGLMLCHHHL